MPDAQQPPPLHRNPDFRRLWIGQACSELGSSAANLAYPLLVLALTGSPVQAGLVGTVSLGASALFGLPAGALVDRWNRRRVMIGCEIVRALAVITLVIALLAGRASLPLILVTAAVSGAAGALFGPAQSAALRHIVPTAQLPTASARNEARSYAAELAGPPLGGALFGLTRFAPFLADAISFVVSALAIAGIRRPLQDERTEPHEPVHRAVWLGLKFVVAEPFLRAVLCLAPLVNAALGGVMFLLILMLQDRGVPPAGIGAMQSVILVGGLAGALVAPWLLPRFRTQVLIPMCLCSLTVVVTIAAVVPGTYLIGAVLAAGLLLSPALNAGLFGYQIAITPDAMQGRVDSTIGLLAQGLQPVAPLAAGLLFTTVGGQWAMACFAAVLAATAAGSVLSKGIRGMRPLEEIAVGSSAGRD
ncbi:MFS transporter [Flindersiella endophytica]